MFRNYCASNLMLQEPFSRHRLTGQGWACMALAKHCNGQGIDALAVQPHDEWEESMTAKKKDDRPEKHGKQGADLGQKEAALEKEKENEMHHMGKGQPRPSTDKTKDTQARNPGTKQ